MTASNLIQQPVATAIVDQATPQSVVASVPAIQGPNPQLAGLIPDPYTIESVQYNTHAAPFTFSRITYGTLPDQLWDGVDKHHHLYHVVDAYNINELILDMNFNGSAEMKFRKLFTDVQGDAFITLDKTQGCYFDVYTTVTSYTEAYGACWHAIDDVYFLRLSEGYPIKLIKMVGGAGWIVVNERSTPIDVGKVSFANMAFDTISVPIANSPYDLYHNNDDAYKIYRYGTVDGSVVVQFMTTPNDRPYSICYASDDTEAVDRTITLLPFGTDTFDGAASYVLNIGDFVTFIFANGVHKVLYSSKPVEPALSTATSDGTPVDTDEVITLRSGTKRSTWTVIKAFFKTYFDTLYVLAGGKAGGQTISGGTAAGESITITGTASATKSTAGINLGALHVDEVNNRVGVGITDIPVNFAVNNHVEDSVVNGTPTTVEINSIETGIDRPNSTAHATLLVNTRMQASGTSARSSNGISSMLHNLVSDTQNYNALTAMYSNATIRGASSVSTVRGTYNHFNFYGTGTLSSVYGNMVTIGHNGTGIITEARGVDIRMAGSSNIVTAYGIYIGPMNANTKWAIYSTSAAASLLAGPITATQHNLSALNSAPASATATGTLGEIRWANGYVYLCVATNTWQRAALTTW